MIRALVYNRSDLMISPDLSVVLGRLFPIVISQEEPRDEEISIYHSSQKMIDYIEELYILKNPEEIKMFLVSNDDLIHILLEAQAQIKKIFGQFPVFLELYHDPEEEWDELFIVIKTSYSPEKAVELESRLFDEWFMDIQDQVGNRLNFTEAPL